MRSLAGGAGCGAGGGCAVSERRFDLIVFDWDGTLFDSTALITRCIQSACVDMGLPAPSDRDASYVIGMGLVEALQHAAPGLARDRYGELGSRYRHHYSTRQHELALFDGVLGLLDKLGQRGHLLGIATGKSRLGLDEVLATVELHGRFDATRTADQTASKPHPQMLLELMDELGVDAERTLMIGDTTHDLLLASNAGAASVGVGYGAHEHSGFAEHRPLFVAHSVAELEDWLLRHG
ncbi:HAD-IA family hydrolase [Piscinibacter sakaiensis]|uniref:HAD-IA family hydrolase n=1 Tax=Piscinibacter sakaiensis TaxID=1547922 RepID=UPI003AABE2DE